MATPSVLVVGSTGSIGRHVVHAAALRGLGIRALSRDAARANRAFAGIPGVEVVQGDATEPASLLRFVDAVDAVIEACGCSVIYAHHHPKGTAGQKKSMDRMSGTGVYARDADVMVDLTAIEIPDNDRADTPGGGRRGKSSLSLRNPVI